MRQEHSAFVWIAYGVLAIMNLLDLWYTNRAILSGIGEANPIMNHFHKNYGAIGMAVFKGVGLGLLFCFVPIINQYRIAKFLFYVAVFVYTLLTFYHLWIYLSLGGILDVSVL